MRESTTSLCQLYEIVAKVVEFQNVGFCGVVVSIVLMCFLVGFCRGLRKQALLGKFLLILLNMPRRQNLPLSLFLLRIRIQIRMQFYMLALVLYSSRIDISCLYKSFRDFSACSHD
jgi:hypothetical protein